MVSLRMCSIKMNTPRYRFWIGLHLSWMILLFHPRVLKELATELGPVFAHLFQQSIDTGEIPKGMVSCKYLPSFQEE